MARGLMKRAESPAEGERKCGSVNRAQRANWANVIKGPRRWRNCIRFGLRRFGAGWAIYAGSYQRWVVLYQMVC